MSAHYSRIADALASIRDAIEAGHPCAALLEMIEALDRSEAMHRDLIMSAGDSAETWLAEADERDWGRRCDARQLDMLEART